jgi:hypothetical protein
LIRQWKAEELSTPLASAIFRRLGVEEAIGGTGSVRARVVVIALFLLLLLTPLQLAFNQVRSELRARQAVARALDMFNVPNRSAIIGSSIALTEDRVDVRLQVATSALFSAEERARFEQRIHQETGRRARVDLVQTVADVGDAGTLRQLLERERARRLEALPSVRSSLQEAEGLLSGVLREATLPSGARIVGVRTSLGNARGPGLELTYLSERDLDSDAQALLARLLSVQTQMPPDRITLAWLPATRALRIAPGGALDPEAAAALGDVRMRVLPQLAELAVTVTVTQNLRRAEADAVARRIQEDLGLSEMPAVVTDPAMDRRTAVLRIAIQAESSQS